MRAAGLFPKNLKEPIVFCRCDELALYRLGSCRTANFKYFSRPGSSYRCHPPNTFHSGRAQPPNRERLRFPANLRGVRARRTSPEGRGLRPPARGAPLPTSTRSFVSRRHKSRGDPRSRTGLQCWQAIVREGAQRPVIKYTYICIDGKKREKSISFNVDHS